MNQIQGTPPLPATSSAPPTKGKESSGITFRQTYEQAQQNTAAPKQEQTQAQDVAEPAVNQPEEGTKTFSETPDRTIAETAVLLAVAGMFQPVDALVPEENTPATGTAPAAAIQPAALSAIQQASVAPAAVATVVANPETQALPDKTKANAVVAETLQLQSKETPAFADRLVQERAQAIIEEILPEKQAEPVRTSVVEHSVTLQELSAKNRTVAPQNNRFDSMVQQAQEKLVSHASPKTEAPIVAEIAKQNVLVATTAEEEPEVLLASTVLREAPVATTTQTFAAKTEETPVFEQVRDELVQNLQQGTTSFQMRLKPQELGEVTVRMELREGKLTVHLTAATPAARSLLERQMEHLAASLKNTVEVEQVQVTPPQSSPDSGSTPFQMNSGSHPQQQQQAFSGKAQGSTAQAVQPEIQQQTPSESNSILDRAV